MMAKNNEKCISPSQIVDMISSSAKNGIILLSVFTIEKLLKELIKKDPKRETFGFELFAEKMERDIIKEVKKEIKKSGSSDLTRLLFETVIITSRIIREEC